MKSLNNNRGVSLIEVLVTVLILAISLLAIAALQTRSLEYNHSAYLRTQANIIAYDIFDQMRITSPANGAPQLLSDAQRAALVSSLPDGDANVACVGRICTVEVIWAEKDGINEGGLTSSFTYTTRL